MFSCIQVCKYFIVNILELPKNTGAVVAVKKTNGCSPATFEMDIMKAMDIKEDRTTASVYWY